MEILYRVDKMTFTDRESAEQYERKLVDSLVTKLNLYKSFYLPTAFRNYKKSLERLRDAREYFRIKSYTRITELCTAHEEWLEKKRIIHERIAEYRNTKALIRLLSVTEKRQKNKKTERKK